MQRAGSSGEEAEAGGLQEMGDSKAVILEDSRANEAFEKDAEVLEEPQLRRDLILNEYQPKDNPESKILVMKPSKRESTVRKIRKNLKERGLIEREYLKKKR